MEAVWEQDIWPRVKKTCEDLNLPVVIPRRCGEMIHENNTPEILQTYSSEEQLEFHSWMEYSKPWIEDSGHEL